MIQVIHEGRLGNQLFQLAFALGSAERLKVDFRMIAIRRRTMIYRYFEIEPTKLSQLLAIYYLIVGRVFPKYKHVCLSQIHISDYANVEANLEDLKDHRTYQGTFSSARYFTNVDSEIRRQFRVRSRYRFQIDNIPGVDRLRKKVVIHIRRTDYLNFGTSWFGGKDLSLPIEYYRNCLQQIEDLESYQIVAIGDDLDFVSKGLSEYDILLTRNSEIIDFQILQQANISIISNSTFAWWAAYLGTSNTVFAPNYWLGFRKQKVMPEAIFNGLADKWKFVNFDYT